MHMFIPLFVAMCVLVASFLRFKMLSYILWIVLFIVTMLVFIHHMSDPLNISL